VNVCVEVVTVVTVKMNFNSIQCRRQPEISGG